MHSDLVELGWTEEQWSRIANTVAEEAQKARVAAQVLPVVGPEEPSTIAVANLGLGNGPNPFPFPPQLPAPAVAQPVNRLTVDSDPTLFLTTISVNVQLRTHEAADPDLAAALGMFRRAANYVARLEDALVFNGRRPSAPPRGAAVPPVFTIAGSGAPPGLMLGPVPNGRIVPPVPPAPAPVRPAPVPPPPAPGNDVFNQIVAAIGALERNGQFGPFGCFLSSRLFDFICTPTDSMILPRDRILPFLNGPLIRTSAIAPGWGAVVALSGNPVELIVASDVSVRYLQTTLEPRFVFRVSERVALRIKEGRAIALLG